MEPSTDPKADLNPGLSTALKRRCFPLHCSPKSQPASSNLGIEAWAEWERHFKESDILIAAFLGPHVKTGWIADLRRDNPFYWRHLENRAKAEGPRRSQRAAEAYLGEYHGPEYVRPSERADNPIAEALPLWVMWSVFIAAAAWFFGRPIILAVFDYMEGIF